MGTLNTYKFDSSGIRVRWGHCLYAVLDKKNNSGIDRRSYLFKSSHCNLGIIFQYYRKNSRWEARDIVFQDDYVFHLFDDNVITIENPSYGEIPHLIYDKFNDLLPMVPGGTDGVYLKGMHFNGHTQPLTLKERFSNLI